MKKYLIIATLFLSFCVFSQKNRYTYPMGIKNGIDEKFEGMPQKASLTRQFYTNFGSSSSLKMYSPTPRSQGEYGTCTAWAVVYAARTIIEAQRNNWTDKDRIDSNAFTPAFTYRMVEPNNQTCWGAYTGEAISSLVDNGALPLKYWNYTGNSFHCPQFEIDEEKINIASTYKLKEYTKLFGSSYNQNSKTELVKLSISNGNPVVISMICPASFHHVSDDLWVPEENPAIGEHGRHAMVTIAYDDNKYGGAFLIQNSWGQNYGDGGYVWIKYDDFSKFVYQAIELVHLPKLVKYKDPIFKGKLRVYAIDQDKDLDVNLTSKYRQWNTNLGGQTESNYKVSQPLESGSRVRLYIENEQPAFVYLLSTTSVDESVHRLFPSEGSGLSAALNYKDNEIALPNEIGNFQMDDQIGTDYMLMLFSRNNLDIKKVKSFLENSKKSKGESLKDYFGDNLIVSEDVIYSSNEISFETKYKGDDDKVLALIIEYEHVR